MKQVITIQIIRPEIQGLNNKDRKQLITDMSLDIAEQILRQEEMRIKSEEIAYWQQKLLQWEVEDHVNGIKYGQQRTDQQRD